MQPTPASSPTEILARAAAQERAGDRRAALAILQPACADTGAGVQLLVEGARLAAALGEHALAAAWLARAVQAQPSRALRFSHALALLESGATAAAESAVLAALQTSPREFRLLNLLGVVQKRLGRIEEALATFQRAAKADPKAASPWVNAGNCHAQLERHAKAADAYERATRLDARNAENFRLLGRAAAAAHDPARARAAYRQALARNAGDPRLHLDWVQFHYAAGEIARAAELNDRALEAFPAHPDLRRQRASLLRRLGRIDASQAAFEALLAERPDDVETLVMLGNLFLWGRNDRRAANALYERALALQPGHAEARRQYCESLANSRHDDEMAHFQKAWELAVDLLDHAPDPVRIAGTVQGVFLRAADFERVARLGSMAQLTRHWVAEMSVAHLHNQLGRVVTDEDRRLLLDAHRQWGDRVQALAAADPLPPRPRRVRAPVDKIRIGLMSSDLRHHPVTYFVQPLLELYDHARFELHCYSFYPGEPDPVQQRIAAIVDGFNVIRSGSDREIAARIAADDIDILFELGGTTLLNRVNVCAWRPAPVQVSWLGYPHSAGLGAIDYLLVDPVTRPASADLMLERPFLMPETWVSLGSLGFRDLAIDAGIPEERQGWITFGTANNPYKYTPECFAAWAAVMRAVPDSRFLFLRPEGGSAAFRGNVLRLFAGHGIAAERILFEPVRGTHMPHYNRIDIALDPFPHVGGTNTCESLWMGVPVVTLLGPAMFERLSASNLHNAGLADLCANSVAEYVRIAVALAADRARRQDLRGGLRARIAAHPLGQTERFTRHFENTVIEVLNTP